MARVTLATIMIILDYTKKHHAKIISACVRALRQGKVIAYPTDTSYGLAVDTQNIKAVKKLYQVKGRNFNKASSVVVPSIVYAKKIVKFDKIPSILTKKFWPGPLTLVLQYTARPGVPLHLVSKGNFLGIRFPKNPIALDLAKHLGRPITATSANVSGRKDCYSVDEIIKQYKNKKLKPDIIINSGKLKKNKPSTILKINEGKTEILRTGPISKKQINKILSL